MLIDTHRIQEFFQRHLPVVFDNPTLCLLVLGMIAAMALLFLLTRNRGALVVAGAALLYFVPFVRL